MKSSELRRSQILQELDSQGSVTVLTEAARHQTSPMTIRRDLMELERTGLVRRVHGGAVAARGRSYEPPYITRAQEAHDAKASIADTAAHLVTEGESIAIDTGSTCHQVAMALTSRRNLTIVTPALRVAEAMSEASDVRVILTGGVLRQGENSLVGNLAARAFHELSVDRLFLGCAGVDPAFGISDYNWDDVLVKQAMVRSAKEVVLVADSRKFSHIAFARIAGLEAVSTLITDQQPAGPLAEALQSAGVAVVLASAVATASAPATAATAHAG